MNTQVVDKARTILAEAHVGPGGALQEILLNLLMQIILDVIGNCFGSGNQASDVLHIARNRPLIARIMVDNAVRRELRSRFGLFGYARNDGAKLTETILKAAQNQSVSEQDINDLAQLGSYQ